MKNKNDMTELVLIPDRSGLMQGQEKDTICGFSSMIEKQKKGAGVCYVARIFFVLRCAL